MTVVGCAPRGRRLYAGSAGRPNILSRTEIEKIISEPSDYTPQQSSSFRWSGRFGGFELPYVDSGATMA